MKDREEIIAVYMMANRFDGSIYTGVTAHLLWRIQQHKDGVASGFTRKYRCTSLVWWEAHGLIVDAIKREKRIKKWPCQWKINLIEAANPRWEDLWDTLWAVPPSPEIDLRPWKTRLPRTSREMTVYDRIGCPLDPAAALPFLARNANLKGGSCLPSAPI